MAKFSSREVRGHEVVEHRSPDPYQPYGRLVLRDPKGRTISTVLSCERVDKGWNVTAIRCPRGCQTHHRER